MNRLERELMVVARFEDGKTFRVGVAPNEVWWMGYDKAPLVELQVSDASAVLNRLSRHEIVALHKGEPLIIIVDASGLRSLTKEEFLRQRSDAPSPKTKVNLQSQPKPGDCHHANRATFL